MTEDQWWSCYTEGLKGIISSSSFAHPAKVSLALAKRICRHAIEEQWLRPGDLCVDPMAGVATFGLVAATYGIRWLSIELEERFCALGQGNIALHTREWLALGKPLPMLIQGDARQLLDIVEQARLVVSSPPYADAQIGPQNTGNSIKQRRKQGLTASNHEQDGYGESNGQVGNLSDETYWSEMAKIYAACYQVLPSGGHIILVVKGFIRRSVYQDLPMQTAQLLEHVGFTVLHYHKAMLSSPVGQARLFDDGEDRTSRKSFFRRLAEQKGAPVIDYEAVICAEKL